MRSNHYEVSHYGNCLEYLGNVQNIETDAKRENSNNDNNKLTLGTITQPMKCLVQSYTQQRIVTITQRTIDLCLTHLPLNH